MKYKGNNEQEFEALMIDDKTISGLIKKIDWNMLSWVVTGIAVIKLTKWADSVNVNDIGYISSFMVVALVAYLIKFIISSIMALSKLNDDNDIERMLGGMFYSSYGMPLFRIIILSNYVSLVISQKLLLQHIYNIILFTFEKV